VLLKFKSSGMWRHLVGVCLALKIKTERPSKCWQLSTQSDSVRCQQAWALSTQSGSARCQQAWALSTQSDSARCQQAWALSTQSDSVRCQQAWALSTQSDSVRCQQAWALSTRNDSSEFQQACTGLAMDCHLLQIRYSRTISTHPPPPQLQQNAQFLVHYRGPAAIPCDSLFTDDTPRDVT
jgi:hypothetical protein